MNPIATDLRHTTNFMRKGRGYYLDKEGYRRVLVKGHPGADKDGYVREHRLVMESLLGRYLTQDEEVHHIDGNKLNNVSDNMIILSKKDHAWWHGVEKTTRWKEINGSKIKFLYKDTNMSGPEIAKELGVSVSQVYKYLKGEGVILKGVDKLLSSKEDIETAKIMHSDGSSFAEIGRYFGVSWSTVARRIRGVSY